MTHYIRPSRPVHKVYVHCSASDNPNHDNIETIRHWHINERGWADVGYHFFIRSDGTVERGRSTQKPPAAQAGHNSGSIAVCLHGLSRFTLRQFDSLHALCCEIVSAHEGRVTFHGHREVAEKTCPVFDYRSVLGLNDRGYMATGRVPALTEPPVENQTAGAISMTSRGPLVAEAQKLLGITADGLFGPQTHRAVVEFQRQRGLDPDGIIGPMTWAALKKEPDA